MVSVNLFWRFVLLMLAEKKKKKGKLLSLEYFVNSFFFPLANFSSGNQFNHWRSDINPNLKVLLHLYLVTIRISFNHRRRVSYSQLILKFCCTCLFVTIRILLTTGVGYLIPDLILKFCCTGIFVTIRISFNHRRRVSHSRF
jgi:hypothetical protein